jgi:hypothetical protein
MSNERPIYWNELIVARLKSGTKQGTRGVTHEADKLVIIARLEGRVFRRSMLQLEPKRQEAVNEGWDRCGSIKIGTCCGMKSCSHHRAVLYYLIPCLACACQNILRPRY